MSNKKVRRRKKIRMRIRKKISGTREFPRISIFRSNKFIYAQIIDDVAGETLVSASSLSEEISTENLTKVEQAREVGKLLALKAEKSGIVKAKFDRGGYLYHGRVKALAQGAREGGLKI